MIFHGYHPNSPLSHPALTRKVFFSEKLPEDYVLKFQERVCAYESFLWPFGMFRPFAKPEKMLPKITSWGSGQSIMILAGEIDKIMTHPIMENLATMYRKAYTKLVGSKKLQAEDVDVGPIPGEGGQDTAGHGVRLCVVPGAGHHMQNDVTWEIGAQKLLAFYEQL
jgi:hypothetical protein